MFDDPTDLSDVFLHNKFGQHIHSERRFGPIDCEEVSSRPALLQAFFVGVKRHHDIVTKDVSIIYGRRGSGKTTYLNTSRFVPGNQVIPIPTHELLDTIEKMLRKRELRLVEHARDLWVSELEKECVSTLVNVIGRSRDASGSPSVRERMDAARSRLFLDSDPQPARRNEINLTFRDVDRWAVQQNKKVILLIDSLEPHKITNPELLLAVQGLLKATAYFPAHFDCVRLRVCFPDELRTRIGHVSTNSLKDLSGAQILSWTADELLDIAAYRYNLYLHLEDRSSIRQLGLPGIGDRSKPYGSLLSGVFDKTEVLNIRKRKESLWTYIFRHTYLVPRHVLHILNKVSELSSSGNKKLDSDQVKNAVRKAETLFCQDIIFAISSSEPNAGFYIKTALTNLHSNEVDLKEIEKIYEKKVIPESKKAQLTISWDAFLQTLTGGGVLGMVVNRTADSLEAEFSYNTEGDSLSNIGHGMHLCIHPIWCVDYNISKAFDAVQDTMRSRHDSKVKKASTNDAASLILPSFSPRQMKVVVPVGSHLTSQ